MSNTIPTLPDHLFEEASRGTAIGVDRTEQWRRSYEDDVRQLAETEHVTQGDVNEYSEAWAAFLAARGRCLSTAAAGPSNFKVKPAQRASDRADDLQRELIDLRERILRWAKIRRRQAEIATAGGQEAVDRKNLTELRRYLNMMREANAIVRRKPRNERSDAKIAQLVALDGISPKTAEKLFVRDGGSYGFPRYEMTSAQGKIKRLEAKLYPEPVEVEPPQDDDVFRFEKIGATVTLAHADDLLRVRFDRKPARPMLARLGSLGKLRWARSEGAWQRKLTAQGILSWSAISSVGSALDVDLFAIVRNQKKKTLR
jgi:hypothetical protein